MPKLTVNGDFMLICPQTGIEFNPGEIIEVESLSSFMGERIKLHQLKEVRGAAKAPEKEPAPTAKKNDK